LAVGEAGIEINTSNGAEVYDGVITSSVGVLNIRLNAGMLPGYAFYVYSEISDNEYGKVELNISGNHIGLSCIGMTGKKSNSFTGVVTIEGSQTALILNKEDGAIAISNDVFVKNGAILSLAQSHQIVDSANVTLSNSGVLSFSEKQYDISEKIGSLLVSSRCALEFNHGGNFLIKRYLYLDNLIIESGGELEIRGWIDGQDYLLIRKDSVFLEESINKVDFVGYKKENIHIEDFNEEYYAISGAPEPTTYGTALSLAALGLWSCRRKRRVGNLARENAS